MTMLTFPFEVDPKDIQEDPEVYVDAIFSCLTSDFLTMPKGEGFIDYQIFEHGYEALKVATKGFSIFSPDVVMKATITEPISFIVLRTILGFSPPEWGYVASLRKNVSVGQGFVRSHDRRVRISPQEPISVTDHVKERLQALVETACELLSEKAPHVDQKYIHRFDKADTTQGVESISHLADMGVPYAMLLYERFLGRPFASHRDSVSDLIGDTLELAIEKTLHDAGISYRKTKRAERINGFDQTPDFIIPDEFNPRVIIEAKISEDDGTARDKVTRIQHLAELSLVGRAQDDPNYEVVACIGGRGFGVRREDMKKMILATRGKVFTSNTLDRLIEHTQLKNFCSK